MMSNSACECPRAIALAIERLLQTHPPSTSLIPLVACGFAQPVRLRLSQSHVEIRVFGAPFRAGTTHVVQLGPVAVAYVQRQVSNDASKVGDCPDGVAGKCGPPRIGRCGCTGPDDALPDHLLSPSGCMWAP